jgi:hypothetical protein
MWLHVLTDIRCSARDLCRCGGRRLAAYDSTVSTSLTIRPAQVEDVARMARVNVRCWQESYRGLMSDAVLDDPDFLTARERFWTAALTDERYRENRVAVAERDGKLVGIAMSGPPLDAAAPWARQLYVLYVHAADHGTGAGQRCSRRLSIPRSRRRCGWPTRTLAHRRSTASTAWLLTGRPRSRTGCGRSAWSGACSTVGNPVRLPGRAVRSRGGAHMFGGRCSQQHANAPPTHKERSSRWLGPDSYQANGSACWSARPSDAEFPAAGIAVARRLFDESRGRAG